MVEQMKLQTHYFTTCIFGHGITTCIFGLDIIV